MSTDVTTPQPNDMTPVASPSWPMSRIVLLIVLAICLALLAFDQLSGRLPQKRAYEKLNANLLNDAPTEGQKPIGQNIVLLSPSGVHRLLGREPDSVESNAGKAAELMFDPEAAAEKKPAGGALEKPALVESYRFRGVLHSYTLRVSYLKGAVVRAPEKEQDSLILSGVKPVTE